MICDRWDLILAPYPYVEVFDAKVRPALVLTVESFNARHQVCFAAMITTAKALTDLRDDDFAMADLNGTGLTRPCVIRMSRISTIDLSDGVRKIGEVARTERTKVERTLKAALGI